MRSLVVILTQQGQLLLSKPLSGSAGHKLQTVDVDTFTDAGEEAERWVLDTFGWTATTMAKQEIEGGDVAVWIAFDSDRRPNKVNAPEFVRLWPIEAVRVLALSRDVTLVNRLVLG